jgi:hypothetical protein
MAIVGASIGKAMKILPVLLSALVLASCASYGGRGLLPGTSTEAQLREVMGEPRCSSPIPTARESSHIRAVPWAARLSWRT